MSKLADTAWQKTTIGRRGSYLRRCADARPGWNENEYGCTRLLVNLCAENNQHPFDRYIPVLDRPDF
jgi:hypothetical protein